MPFVRSYYPDYFSIQDIMVTQESLTCTTEASLRGLGFLVPGNDREDLEKNTQLEMPVWLVKHLQPYDRANTVRSQIPKAFSTNNRDIFEADAKVINLFRINPHFYEFGVVLASFNHKEADFIHSLIIKAFKDRFRLVMDWADNVMTEQHKVQMLDTTERNLLKMGHRARALLDAWLVDGAQQMQAAELVLHLRKRRLMQES